MVEKIKEYIKYVIGPILGLLAYIYYQSSKIRGLEKIIGQVEQESKVNDAIAVKNETEKLSNESGEKWESIRSNFVDELGKSRDDHS